jgi:hypothetical protein
MWLGLSKPVAMLALRQDGLHGLLLCQGTLGCQLVGLVLVPRGDALRHEAEGAGTQDAHGLQITPICQLHMTLRRV